MPPEQTEAVGTAGYSKAELASLTPDELSALELENGDEDGHLAALAEGAEDAGAADAAAAETTAGADGASGTAATPPPPPAAPAAAPGDGSAAAAPAADAKPEAKADDKPAMTPAPAPVTTLYKAEAPADIDAQLATQKGVKAAAKAEETKAMKQLMDGDIDFDAYQAVKAKSDEAIEAANETISDLKAAKTRVTVSEEMNAQQGERAWDAEVQAVVTLAKADGIDYKAKPELWEELNALVRGYGAQAATKGLDDAKGLEASKWALAEAQKIMVLKYGTKPAATPAPGAAPAAAAAPAAQRHDVRTLGALPNADRTAVNDDILSRIGSLEGEDLEIAMAKMSPSDIEKILAGTDA